MKMAGIGSTATPRNRIHFEWISSRFFRRAISVKVISPIATAITARLMTINHSAAMSRGLG
jgi:hypothetical protein